MFHRHYVMSRVVEFSIVRTHRSLQSIYHHYLRPASPPPRSPTICPARPPARLIFDLLSLSVYLWSIVFCKLRSNFSCLLIDKLPEYWSLISLRRSNSPTNRISAFRASGCSEWTGARCVYFSFFFCNPSWLRSWLGHRPGCDEVSCQL